VADACNVFNRIMNDKRVGFATTEVVYLPNTGIFT